LSKEGGGLALVRESIFWFHHNHNPMFPLKKEDFKSHPIANSILPWLSVKNSREAVHFYKSAFGADEMYRLEAPDGSVVSRLSVNGAEFWLSEDSADNPGSLSLAGGRVRMILTTTEPDVLFDRVLKAGASEVFPVAEEYGWRMGRLVDPFGHHWEIGRPIDAE
jgi:PhnB protein